VEQLDELVDRGDGAGPRERVVGRAVAARVLRVIGLGIGDDLGDPQRIRGGGRREEQEEDQVSHHSLRRNVVSSFFRARPGAKGPPGRVTPPSV